MSAKPRRAIAAVAALALALVLTACQQTQTKADLQRDAEFARECTRGGGHVYYRGISDEIISCDFTTPKRDR